VILTEWLNIVGLILDILGFALLFWFGLPPNVSRDGSVFILLEQVDQTEKSKAALYDGAAWVALFFIVGGFIFQIAANLV
jgi:hypothetical protein